MWDGASFRSYLSQGHHLRSWTPIELRRNKGARLMISHRPWYTIIARFETPQVQWPSPTNWQQQSGTPPGTEVTPCPTQRPIIATSRTHFWCSLCLIQREAVNINAKCSVFALSIAPQQQQEIKTLPKSQRTQGIESQNYIAIYIEFFKPITDPQVVKLVLSTNNVCPDREQKQNLQQTSYHGQPSA